LRTTSVSTRGRNSAPSGARKYRGVQALRLCTTASSPRAHVPRRGHRQVLLPVPPPRRSQAEHAPWNSLDLSSTEPPIRTSTPSTTVSLRTAGDTQSPVAQEHKSLSAESAAGSLARRSRRPCHAS